VKFKKLRLYVAQQIAQQNVAAILLVLWGLFILYGTMLPFDFSASGDLIHSRLRVMWERPLRGLGGSWADVYSNIAFFMPWGFLLATWLVSRGWSWWRTLAVAVASAACLSGSVEIVQLFAPMRSPSVIDFVTNTFGSMMGAWIGWPLARWIWPVVSVRTRQFLMARPIGVCAVAVATTMLFAGLAPSYNKLGVSGAAAALEMARLIPFGPSAGGPTPSTKTCLWVAELLAWTLAGGVFALAARESKRDGVRAVGPVVALAICLSLVVEVIQIVIPGRDVDLTSVLLAAVGSALGATIVIRLRAVESRHWTVPALLIWGVAIILVTWNPPRFTWPAPPFLRAERFVPFWSYFDSRSLEDLTDVVGQAIVFMPLGALLAARSWRQSFLSAILIGFGLGVILEFGQVFLPTRTADVSDAISAAAGAGLGLALWRWGEQARTSSLGATRYRVGARGGGKG
jgi:VanZ family protein